MACASALLRLFWVFGLVFGMGMARRGLLPTPIRARLDGSLRARVEPLVGTSDESRPAPVAVAAPHRLSARALATASLLAVTVCLAALDSKALAADSGSGPGSSTEYTKSSAARESPLPPRLSTWDFAGRIQRLEDTSFTKEDARLLEVTRKEEARLLEVDRKEEVKAMIARMDRTDEKMQENFRTTTFLSIVSLFISLAANEGFVAKLFPPR